MIDQFGRNINYLRISVTDKCNLRCGYCIPPGQTGLFLPENILTNRQLLRLVSLFAEAGINRIRLTGGEPLLREDLPELIKSIKNIKGIDNVSVTTNGLLLHRRLPDLLHAGLDGINLSLDTLDARQYAKLTGSDTLLQVIKGLNETLNLPATEMKLNCVIQEDNISQIVPLAQLAWENRIAVRFIELMPFGPGQKLKFISNDMVLTQLEKAFGPAQPIAEELAGGPAEYVMFHGFCGKVGFISAVSRPFCLQCNRIRITANGLLKPCLQYRSGKDLKALMDSGADDDSLRTAIEETVKLKPKGHHFGKEAGAEDEGLYMNQIGG